MTTSDRMQRLQAVLDTYGADPRRWPDADRAALELFVAESADAQAVMAGEAAFDRLLSAAADDVASDSTVRVRTALFEKLEAELYGTHPGSGLQGAVVVPFTRTAKQEITPVQPRRMWREISVMAASLLIGFFTVSQGVLEGSGFDPAKLTATSVDYADDVSTIALVGPEGDTTEEDLL